MSNQSNCRWRRVSGAPQPLQKPLSPSPEPARPPREIPMRRWPHPVECAPRESEPDIQDLRRALAYQNQLLGEIRTLLERLASSQPLPPNA